MVKRERGHVLLLALFVIFMAMTAGALLAGSLQFRMNLLRQEVQDIHLTALADGGLAIALDRLSVTPWWTGSVVQDIGGGSVTVEVSNTDQVMTMVVDVYASYDRGGRAVRAQVLLSDFSPPRVVSWEPIPYEPPRQLD